MNGTVFSVQLRHAGTGFRENIHDGNIGLQGTGVQTRHLHIAKDGTGHQEGRGAGPVRLDGKIRRPVTLAAPDAEIHARAQAPVLRFKEGFVALHFRTNVDAEFLQDIYGYKQVRDAARLMDIEDRFFLQERQGCQQATHQLGATFAGDIGPPREERSRHLERQVAIRLAGCIALRVQPYAIRRHNVVRICQRPRQQRFFSRDPDRFRRQGGEQRNHQAREETRLAGMELLQVKTAFPCADSFDNELRTIYLHLGPERLRDAQRTLVVPAGRIAAQVGRAFRQRCGNNGPLGKTLGRGHGKHLRLHKTEIPIHGLLHGLHGPLAGCRSVLFAQAGIGKRSAAF